MIIWALWMDGLLYFSTGAKSRKAQNIMTNPHSTMCTDQADQAVILEGVVETEGDLERIREFVLRYEKKYNWKLGEMGDKMIALEDPVFYLRPRVAFGLWEKKFSSSATRWIFPRA